MGTNKKVGKHRLTFARNVVALRTSLKLTQERLGELADLHPTYISSIEHGQRNISIDAMERLAKALKVSLSQLVKE